MAFLARNMQDVPAKQLTAFDPSLTTFVRNFKQAHKYVRNSSGVGMWKAVA